MTAGQSSNSWQKMDRDGPSDFNGGNQLWGRKRSIQYLNFKCGNIALKNYVLI